MFYKFRRTSLLLSKYKSSASLRLPQAKVSGRCLAWTVKAGSQRVDDVQGQGVWRKGAEVDEY